MTKIYAARRADAARKLRSAVAHGWAHIDYRSDGTLYNLFEEAALLLELPVADAPRSAKKASAASKNVKGKQA